MCSANLISNAAFKLCIIMEMKPTVAFQGEKGAYSEAAAFEYFGEHIDVIPCEQFEDVFAKINNGVATHAILPIENSQAGSIHRNYDLILRNDLYISGEYNFRVRHCLLALPGVHIENILSVHSHPQALAQCENRLARLGVKRVAETDTAGSARLIVERGDQKAAAIASLRAAQVYGLEVLEEGIEDNTENFTRFIALTSQPFSRDDMLEGEYKTSVVFSLINQPGVLFKALSVFALRDIDLTKIESRPDPGKTWEYLFYIDFAGHAEEQKCALALNHLQELAPFMRVLGSYPRHNLSG